ncbi:uncharacterized protein LOC126843184 [Adelges cooleyi]|uniref:uncharacterized protein LOC126843184 n=1 Tax=Adelges cooleyi TaxID=133065 RepID=UPI0021801B09|nr:uncharacterized protein LOC126843184 [Adelges cooleyi]
MKVNSKKSVSYTNECSTDDEKVKPFSSIFDNGYYKTNFDLMKTKHYLMPRHRAMYDEPQQLPDYYSMQGTSNSTPQSDSFTIDIEQEETSFSMIAKNQDFGRFNADNNNNEISKPVGVQIEPDYYSPPNPQEMNDENLPIDLSWTSKATTDEKKKVQITLFVKFN